ncbi:GSCOCG00012699001-RA-CDS, partial [Cotesia congregata]
ISFTWNTDGISLFKSSKFSLWPFYLTINELPFKDRTKKENLLLAGIWFGVKPQPNLFLNSFRNDLQKIYQGIWCRTPDLNSLLRVRGMIICGTGDLPAKASFLNMKGHNAIFGCCHCTIQSKYFNKRRIYPLKKKLLVRTTEEAINNSEKAVKMK